MSTARASGNPAAARPSAREVIARLRTMGSARNVAGMACFGISTDGTLGISVPALRKLARELGRDHALARELWASGVHEARSLACMVEDPALVTRRQAGAWVRDVDSWDVCDGFAYDLISRTPIAWEMAARWAPRREEFVRRAAFALIAGIAVHDKAAPDRQFRQFFPLIRAAADDDRNLVRKAVNWALRQVGKRSAALNAQAIACAEQLQRDGSRAGRWIASDALRELRGEAVQSRLRARWPLPRATRMP